MTLIFRNNNYKYELESVVKLFIPATKFNIKYDVKSEYLNSDYVYTSLKIGKKYTYLFTVCKAKDKRMSKCEKLLNTTSNLKGECEMAFARMLYKSLQAIFKTKAKWGILTGIRPVKRVNSLIDEGFSQKEITDILSKDFLCSEEKSEIAYKTAITQRAMLKSVNDNTFSLYISIPFCKSRCSYCSFVSQSVESCLKLIPEYVDYLCKEIEYTSKITKELNMTLDTVYFGGGTPTAIEATHIDKIMKAIQKNFDLSNIREYTVEAGRADTITKEKLDVIYKNGADRISVNSQTLNDNVLKEIGRNHTAEDFFNAYNLARQTGFKIINTDLIAGLPTDTFESFKKTLDKIIEIEPENITVHTLSIKRAATLNEDASGVLDNPTDDMISYANKTLLKAGYNPYYLYRQKNMIDNLENIGWSKKGYESIYNIDIMEENQSIIAMGAGASTKLLRKSDGKIIRIYNYKFPLEYIKHFDIMLDKKDEIKDFFNAE